MYQLEVIKQVNMPTQQQDVVEENIQLHIEVTMEVRIQVVQIYLLDVMEQVQVVVVQQHVQEEHIVEAEQQVVQE